MTTTLILALFCGVPENKWGHISLHLAYLLKAKKKNLGRLLTSFCSCCKCHKKMGYLPLHLNDIFRNAIKNGKEQRSVGSFYLLSSNMTKIR